MRQVAGPYNLWTLDAANEQTGFILTQDFRHAVFTFVADNSASATLKFYASNEQLGDQPDLTAAASATNVYATTQVIALEDASAVNGDTGVVYAGSSDGVTQYEINQNGNRRLGVKMTARAAGDVTIFLSLYDNS
jgi:hypothetical protein